MDKSRGFTPHLGVKNQAVELIHGSFFCFAAILKAAGNIYVSPGYKPS